MINRSEQTERVTRGGAVAVAIVVSSLSVLGCPVARSDTAPGLEFRHALVVGGSGNPVPSQQMMNGLFEQGIVDDPDPVGVSYPADLWPVHGKLTLDQSVAVGVANLDAALADSTDPVTVVGISQGAVVVNYEKRALMAQSDPPPDISFVTIPRAPVDTPYDTIEIVHEYDGYAGFPDNPLNLLAVLNALAGVVYEHPNKGGVDLSDPRNVVTTTTNSLGAPPSMSWCPPTNFRSPDR